MRATQKYDNQTPAFYNKELIDTCLQEDNMKENFAKYSSKFKQSLGICAIVAGSYIITNKFQEHNKSFENTQLLLYTVASTSILSTIYYRIKIDSTQQDLIFMQHDKERIQRDYTRSLK